MNLSQPCFAVAASLCTLCLAPSGCAKEGADRAEAQTPISTAAPHHGFHPIEPVDSDAYWAGGSGVAYEDLDGDGVAGNTNAERLSVFPIEAAHVQMVTLTAKAEAGNPIVSAHVAAAHYVVVLDYVKYRTDETTEGCLVQTGVGIRMLARVEVLEGGGRVTGPFALAAAASAGEIRGDLSFQTIGVHGKAVSPLIPLPSKLSEESMRAGLQAAVAIKASMYADEEVLIRPQVFGHAPPEKCRTAGTATSVFARSLAEAAETKPASEQPHAADASADP